MPPFDLSVPSQLTLALGPDLLLMGGAMLLLLWSAWRRESPAHQRAVGLAALLLTAVTGVFTIWYLFQQRTATAGPIAVDNFRWLADVVILMGTAFAIALGIEDNDRQGIVTAESHCLILLASSGMMLLAAAHDLMVVFLGIELMSISVYALAGINRRSERSAEAALKYFLLGAFSTAFLLYGIALVYGATGSTSFTVIAQRTVEFRLYKAPLMVTGIGLALVGFGFKVAAVPFHMWAPDVYDGSPSAIAAYMIATVKAAAFIALLRVWFEAFPFASPAWHPAVAGLAVATMVVGNLVGLAQRNIKRMLAYSSIAHAGFLLVAVASGSMLAPPSVLFYLFAYTLATFGAFSVVIIVGRRSDAPVMIDDLAGLWGVRPWLALGTGILMLSLLGFPIFGGVGFFAKWYVLQAALGTSSPEVTLAVVLVLTTVVSAGYYLYVVLVMFMKSRPSDAVVVEPAPFLARLVLVGTVVAILVLGVVPDQLSRLARAGIIGTAPPPIRLPPTSANAPAP
jgi:NADH-quinone oxidoreductase subunit N